MLSQAPYLTAFRYYFGGEFSIPHTHDLKSSWIAIASSPDALRGLAQFTFTAPFYGGVAYSIATWVGMRTNLVWKISEALKDWEDRRFGNSAVENSEK